MPTEKPRPACAGKWDLFDSIELEDHYEAQHICHTQCPMLAECGDLLAEARKAPNANAGVPVGTWAGRLVGVPKSTQQERIDAEDAAYDEAEAKKAHAAFVLGDRDDWAVTGHKVYDRRRHRAGKERRAERSRAAGEAA